MPPPAAALSASYASPTSPPFSFRLDLAAAPAAPAARLAALAAAVADAQRRVNRELTARMDQDRARDAAAPVDDAVAEQNYGEELPDDD